MSACQRRFPAPLAPPRSARWRPAWTTNRRYTRSVVGLLFPPSTSLPASRPPVGSRQQQQQQARRLAGDLGTRTPPGRRHSPPSSHLRAARRPSRPQSGPLRACQTQRWTPGYPPETRECPSTPFPSAAGSVAIRTLAPRLDHQSKVHTLGRRIAVPAEHLSACLRAAGRLEAAAAAAAGAPPRRRSRHSDPSRAPAFTAV